MREGSQILSQHAEDLDERLPQHAASWQVKLMIAYLYFAQGFVLSVAATVPYVYINLPDYFTLSLFSLSTIPFAFKFLTAPILQRYTSLGYGKRKTWIIINQMCVGAVVLLCSFYTGEDQVQKFAMLLFPIYFSLSMQDISLDALCLKELVDSNIMSMMQAAAQSLGSIIGGLVLIKGTSLQFAHKLNLLQPLTSLKTILIGLSIFIFVPTTAIHFLFTQTKLETDQRLTKQSILKVYNIYKYFFKFEYRFFRIILFLLLYTQGINFFFAGYTYQLVENGFSRDTLSTIDNIQNFGVTVLVFLVGEKANYFGFKVSFLVQLSMLTAWYLYLWFFFPMDVVSVGVGNFISGILLQWGSLLRSNLCAHFPQMGATGMIYTMNASASNLGRNIFVHTAILKKLPWKTVSIVGLALQVPIIVFFTPQMLDLIEQGETRIQFEMSQTYEGDIMRFDHQKV